MKKAILLSLALLLALAAETTAQKASSTRSMAEQLMRSAPPRLAFDPATVTSTNFAQWRDSVGVAMAALMRHPGSQSKQPELINVAQRDGYRVERWMSFPLEGSAVPFLVLVPDGVQQSAPRPAVLCIPGFGQTKELLAGELRGNFNLKGDSVAPPNRNAMALEYVRNGLIAVAVDNPACGELSDNGVNDYVASSRFLLECGWSYLGLASWQDKVILDWMKTDSRIRPDRIIVSGFSLGTEPLMVLGAIDPSIYAFVYNDFMCRTRERALTLNAPDKKGARPYPNNIEHLIPGFLVQFDFPDIVAALAPRPLICTEGGMDRDFALIAKAYATAGAPENFTFHHYKKYEDKAARTWLEQMPDGVDRDEFFRLANVDPPNHYFKSEHIIPWLSTLIKH